MSCLVCRVAFIAAGLSTSFPCNGFCFSAVWQRNVISSNARFIAFLEDLQADTTVDKHTFTTAFNSTSRPILRPQNEFVGLEWGKGGRENNCDWDFSLRAYSPSSSSDPF